ncbi:Hyccin [Manis pentadactyla]|nr:Hyccin [Manis pentadactyla]
METSAIQSPLVHGCRKEAPEKAIPYLGATAELPPERAGHALPPLEHCRVAGWLYHLRERMGSSSRSGFSSGFAVYYLCGVAKHSRWVLRHCLFGNTALACESLAATEPDFG